MVGAIAVAGSLLIMRALSQVTSLSVYSLNLVTGLGLGLAIDYSLFVVYRYREELARCGHCSEALERTLGTAGRTVFFSSLTVSVALLSLLVFPQRMLSSMGIAAAIVTVFAATAALIPLGAVLTLLGPGSTRSRRRLQRARKRAEGPVGEGHWYRLAMARDAPPGLVAAACATACCSSGCRRCTCTWARPTRACCRPGSSARVVDADAGQPQFAADDANPVVALVHAPVTGAGAQLRRYRRRARTPAGRGDDTGCPRDGSRADSGASTCSRRTPPLSTQSQAADRRIHALPATTRSRSRASRPSSTTSTSACARTCCWRC
jgi:uncharacterized membrane protein YdfJ with MMPL/SSD domain